MDPFKASQPPELEFEDWQGSREELACGGKQRQHVQAGQKEQLKLELVSASEETWPDSAALSPFLPRGPLSGLCLLM